MARTKKCGDCIHAEICKEVNGGWFSPKNIAYCTAFKERKNCVEVVRCKDCKHYFHYGDGVYGCRTFGMMKTKPDGFCSHGKRRNDG